MRFLYSSVRFSIDPIILFLVIGGSDDFPVLITRTLPPIDAFPHYRTDDEVSNAHCLMTTTILRSVAFGKWKCRVETEAAELYTVGELYFCDTCLMSYPKELTFACHRSVCQVGKGEPLPGEVITRRSSTTGTDAVAITLLRGSQPQDLPVMKRAIDFFRLFLDSKLNVQECDQLEVYLLYKVSDADGTPSIAGFFSRSRPPSDWSLMCIAVLPPYRHQGLGALLMHLSYDLLVKERRTGTPERPLSEGGLRLCHRVWRERVQRALSKNSVCRTWTFQELANSTGLTVDDAKIGFQFLASRATVSPSGAVHFSCDCTNQQ
jgi:hypothetical protein